MGSLWKCDTLPGLSWREMPQGIHVSVSVLLFTCCVFLGKLFLFCTFFVYKTLRVEFMSFVKFSKIL